jgi:glutamyl/glutaminyl-tRNA synthetase
MTKKKHNVRDILERVTQAVRKVVRRVATEFIGARTAYEWLCDALEVYKPRQSEYGRLTLEGSMSQLVESDVTAVEIKGMRERTVGRPIPRRASPCTSLVSPSTAG